MKAPFILILGLLLLAQAGCKPSRPGYGSSRLRLAISFGAKEMCTCRFVMGFPDEICQKYVRVKNLPFSVKADDVAKTTHAGFLWVTEDAKWISERQGCRLSN